MPDLSTPPSNSLPSVGHHQCGAAAVQVVQELKPDNFTPTIVKQTPDYVYLEYQSPTFGFIDDVEFWFPAGKCALLRLWQACRIGVPVMPLRLRTLDTAFLRQARANCLDLA
jgi:uncharacterized protein (DUF1499 family)